MRLAPGCPGRAWPLPPIDSPRYAWGTWPACPAKPMPIRRTANRPPQQEVRVAPHVFEWPASCPIAAIPQTTRLVPQAASRAIHPPRPAHGCALVARPATLWHMLAIAATKAVPSLRQLHAQASVSQRGSRLKLKQLGQQCRRVLRDGLVVFPDGCIEPSELRLDQ